MLLFIYYLFLMLNNFSFYSELGGCHPRQLFFMIQLFVEWCKG